MAKNKKFILLLLTMFSVTLSSLGAAFISQTVNADFEVKRDVIYEDFLKSDEDLDKIITDKQNIEIDEEQYLNIVCTNPSRNEIIYDQYLNTESFNEGGNGDNVIIIKMKSSTLTLDKLSLVIGTDKENYQDATQKPFTALKNENGDVLPELKDEYQEYVISILSTYTDKDMYLSYTAYNNPKPIRDCPVNYIKLVVRDDLMAGFDLEIKSIETSRYDTIENRHMWNNFIGSRDYKKTANPLTTQISSKGEVANRKIKMNPDSFLEITHTNDTNAVTGLVGKYIFIDATGDVENIKVNYSLSPDGVYLKRDYSKYILVDSIVYRMKIEYTGSEEVILNEICLTKHSEDDIVTEVPLIYYGEEGDNFAVLDRFTAEQTLFYTSSQAASSQTNILKQTKAKYRYSVGFKSGYIGIVSKNLYFYAQNNVNKRITYNFSARYDVASNKYQYMVLKAKLEGASLDDLYLCFDENKMGTDNAYKNYKDFYCGYGMPSPLCDDNNPYKFNNNYYFLIIDMTESDIARSVSTFISINYSGQGRVIIDEIFLANEQKVTKVNQKNVMADYDFSQESNTSKVGIVETSNFTSMQLSVKLFENMFVKDENNKKIANKFNNVVFRFDDKEFTIDKLYNTYGTSLDQIFVPDMSIIRERVITINLVYCGIQNTNEFEVINNTDGNFKISNIVLIKETDAKRYMVTDEISRFVVAENLTGADVERGILGTVNLNKVPTDNFSVLSIKMSLDGFEGHHERPDELPYNGPSIDFTSFTLKFDDKDYYVDDEINKIILTNAVFLKDKVIKDKEEYVLYIDLDAMGIYSASTLTIYGDGLLAKAVFSDIYLAHYGNVYNNIVYVSEQQSLNEKMVDITGPSITMGLGEENYYEGEVKLNLAYLDKDTISADDLVVGITVTKIASEDGVTINESIPYELTDVEKTFTYNVERISENITFEASKGKYKVIVKITDLSGNQSSETKIINVNKKVNEDEVKTFNWKPVIYISAAILAVAIIVFGVILVIKIIKDHDNTIKF